jgi:hypothetical protein
MKKNAFLLLSLFSVAVFARDTEFLEDIHKWADEAMEDLPKPGELEGLHHLNDEPLEKEADELIELSKNLQKDEIDGNEAAFHPEILDNPFKELGIVSSEQIEGAVETILRTCEEAGEYEQLFIQKIITKEIPQTKKVKKCNGHLNQKVGKASTKKGKLKEKKEDIKKDFLNGHGVKTFNFTKDIKVDKNHYDIYADRAI